MSDDNPFSAPLFRTCKQRPDYPAGAVGSLTAVRARVLKLAHWYNTEHRHSAIGFVTPHQRHAVVKPEPTSR